MEKKYIYIERERESSKEEDERKGWEKLREKDIKKKDRRKKKWERVRDRRIDSDRERHWLRERSGEKYEYVSIAFTCQYSQRI